MPSLVDVFLGYKWVILFYLAVFLVVFLNRKKLEIHMKVFALYKTQWGVGLMSRLGTRYARPIRMLGYVGIIVGFAAMLAVVAALVYGVTKLFDPSAPAAVSPVIPGVKVPGTNFFVPFWHGIIAIFLVAVIHEFGHGVVASAHRVRIKSSGPFVMGPFFGAFVEPDEESLKRKSDIAQYSIFAAGPFFNLATAGVIFLVVNLALVPFTPVLFKPAGVSFESFSPSGPADNSTIRQGVVYDTFNGARVVDVDQLLNLTRSLKPGDTLVVGNAEGSHEIVVGSHEGNSSAPYLGVVGIKNRYVNDGTFGLRAYLFIFELLVFLFILSIGIGTANLLPMGPIDGGRMVLLVSRRIFGETRGKSVWAKVSVAFLLLMLLLMTPVIKATFSVLFRGFA
ncbi:site-2 protease family protein [Candidatus Woesearchaeota archaeon]|nr:site-2 protease family protein [Candidatus Woesearchaeota archaeon]